MIYQPQEDSYLLEKQVRKFARDKSVLDIGSGSGIQAETALKAGARSVLASDINKEAVKQLKQKNIQSIQSDLLNKINKKFDLIIFNPPYLPEDNKEPIPSREATTGGRLGDEIILKFLKQAPEHLNKDGIILLLLSSLTPKERILKLLKSKNLKKQALSKQKLFFETLEVWKITNI